MSDTPLQPNSRLTPQTVDQNVQRAWGRFASSDQPDVLEGGHRDEPRTLDDGRRTNATLVIRGYASTAALDSSTGPGNAPAASHA